MKWQSMWESNPEQASMLLNPEDGYKYSQCSAQKVEWKCPSCGHIQKAMISNVYKRGLSCLICNDGISIPNKFMASLLEELKEDYTPEYIITGANYRYDFYLPKYNCIIEMHGRQHYESWKKGNMSLEQIQLNDNIKKEYAIQKGIKYYFIINCRIQSYSNMIQEICKSPLSDWFQLDNINWGIVCKKAMKSNMIKTIELYKMGYTSIEIAEILKVSRVTTNRWLEQAHKLRLCNYIKSVGSKYKERKIVLTNTGQVFNSLSEAGKALNINYKNIQRCCAKKSKYSGYVNGYPAVWRYLDEYNPNEQIRYDLLKVSGGRGSAISKYDKNKKYLETYATIKEALKSIGINNGHSDVINRALKDSNEMAYGYYWYYANDLNQPDNTKIFIT